jgi:hypothetical protein
MNHTVEVLISIIRELLIDKERPEPINRGLKIILDHVENLNENEAFDVIIFWQSKLRVTPGDF